MKALFEKRSFRLAVALFTFAGAMLLALANAGRRWDSFLTEVRTFLPVFPAIWVGFEVARGLGALDELQRRIALETMAFGIANTLLVSLAVGLLSLGSPDGLNMACVLPIFLTFSSIGYFLLRRRYQ